MIDRLSCLFSEGAGLTIQVELHYSHKGFPFGAHPQQLDNVGVVEALHNLRLAQEINLLGRDSKQMKTLLRSYSILIKFLLQNILHFKVLVPFSLCVS
mgnify:CR=1 FL=1